MSTKYEISALNSMKWILYELLTLLKFGMRINSAIGIGHWWEFILGQILVFLIQAKCFC